VSGFRFLASGFALRYLLGRRSQNRLTFCWTGDICLYRYPCKDGTDIFDKLSVVLLSVKMKIQSHTLLVFDASMEAVSESMVAINCDSVVMPGITSFSPTGRESLKISAWPRGG